LTELLAALRELPGMHSVGAVQQLPLRGGGYRLGLRFPERPDIKELATEYRIVTSGYLESIGIDFRRGRTISSADRRDTERVVVVNEALAQKYFAGVDPIGKVMSGDVDAPSRIVGVVANAAEKRLIDSAEPVRYVALAQMPWMDLSLMTALSLVLGAIGVYGVIAHYAVRRRRDWAIRVALGLPGSRVIGHVVGHGALLVTAGIVVGIAGAAMLTRLLSSFLYGVSAIDPIAFLTAGAALLAVGTVAAFLPA